MSWCCGIVIIIICNVLPIRLVSPVLLDDWEKECGLSSHTSSKSGDDHGMIAIMTILYVVGFNNDACTCMCMHNG